MDYHFFQIILLLNHPVSFLFVHFNKSKTKGNRIMSLCMYNTAHLYLISICGFPHVIICHNILNRFPRKLKSKTWKWDTHMSTHTHTYMLSLNIKKIFSFLQPIFKLFGLLWNKMVSHNDYYIDMHGCVYLESKIPVHHCTGQDHVVPAYQ